MATKQVKPKIPKPTNLQQSEFTDTVGRVRDIALMLWSLLCPKLDANILKPRMEYGHAPLFLRSDAPAGILQRNEFLSQVVIMANPFMRSYHTALAAWLAGFWKAYSTDVQGYSVAQISKSELRKVEKAMTATKGKDKETADQGLYSILSRAGFVLGYDDQNWATYTLQADMGPASLRKQRAKIIADLEALEKEFPFPTSIARPNRDDLLAKSGRGAQSRHKPTTLCCSAGCSVKPKRSKPVPIEWKEVSAEMFKILNGLPCPTRIKEGVIVEGCGGTMRTPGKTTAKKTTKKATAKKTARPHKSSARA